MIDVLQVLGIFALAVLTLGFAAFCFLFHVLADWRSTQMGRHVMAFMATITVALLYYCVDSAWELPDWLAIGIRAPMFGFMSWVVWKRVSLLIKIQKQARAQAVTKFWSQDGH